MAAAALVKVQLFAEALCPDCINYTTTQLSALMEAVPEIVELQVFPYGNAKETGPDDDGLYDFACQHGENECLGNLFEACAIAHYPGKINDLPEWLPFYECMESSAYQYMNGEFDTTVVSDCATVADGFALDYDVISECAMGEDGNALMHDIAAATPDHTYVPWVVVDGVTVPDSGNGYPDGDLTEIVCAAYTGEGEWAALYELFDSCRHWYISISVLMCCL